MLASQAKLELEPDILWIAEEASQSELPPGWEAHTDEHGRAYFRNRATGESCWQHPKDGFYKQIIEYWRRVQDSGGFWEIENELKDYEEQIRIDLQYWMELLDEQGNKFYYNKRTEESRFDDPRNSCYHDLYARIRMVAKMKDRLPHLAQAPRPGCQPLRGRVELHVQKGESGTEVVLRTTEAHRQFLAAQKIQAKTRSQQTRRNLAPIQAHRAYLNKQAKVIQAQARIFLKVRRAKRGYEQQDESAASLIASSLMTFTAREYVNSLKLARKNFDRFVAAAIIIQSHFRRILAKRKVQRMRERRACLPGSHMSAAS